MKLLVEMEEKGKKLVEEEVVEENSFYPSEKTN